MTHAARFAFLAVLPLLAVAPTVASGDVIKLRTGETVKGRVVAERSNEGVLVVEDFLTGGTRELEQLFDDAVDPFELSRHHLLERCPEPLVFELPGDKPGERAQRREGVLDLMG